MKLSSVTLVLLSCLVILTFFEIYNLYKAVKKKTGLILHILGSSSLVLMTILFVKVMLKQEINLNMVYVACGLTVLAFIYLSLETLFTER